MAEPVLASLASAYANAEQTGNMEAGLLHGSFKTSGLRPGIYTLRASTTSARQASYTAERQIILAPDPFAWTTP